MRIVVTGATNGIGAALAHRLADEGHTVVLVGRDDGRLRASAKQITAAVPGAELVLERADLAELAQVRALAERIASGPPPDVVISNAALIAPPERRDADGVPRLLVVNHLAPYLLLRLLAESLTDRRARFVFVGADPVGLARSPVDLDDLLFEHPERLGEPESIRPFRAYGRTKNMNVMTMTSLARRLADTAITVTGAHPGIIGGTGLSGETPGLTEAVAEAYQLDRSTLPGVEVGADTPAWLATAPEVEGVTGRFYVERRPVETAAHTTDPERCERLWTRTAALVGLPA